MSRLTSDIVDVAGDILAEETEGVIEGVLDELIQHSENRGGRGTQGLERRRSEFWAEVEETLGIENTEGSITLPSDRSARAVFVDFVCYLVDEGYITDSDVPIESGYKRYLLHQEPIDKEGDEMTSPEQVRDYYLETNYSRSDLKQKIAELGERFRESE